MAYTKLGWVNDRAPALNQTNLNHMDQGIYDAHQELSEYEDIFTGDVDESVQNWLDEHPEATTTVQDGSLTTAKYQDGSITRAKLSEALLAPIYIPDGYITINNLMDLSVANTYALFDAYVTDGLLTKQLVGYGSSSASGDDATEDTTLPIYMYSFRNPMMSANGYTTSSYAKPILLSNAMHGNEKMGVPVMLTMIEEYKKGKSQQITALFDNYGIDFIPVLNPYGYNQAIGTTMETVEDNVGRLNARGVDLNRNGTTCWASTVDSAKGNKPLSECESKIIHRIATENGNDYLFYVDIHTERYTESLHKYFGIAGGGSGIIRSLFSIVMSNMNERMKDVYGYDMLSDLNGLSITGILNRSPMAFIDRCYALDSNVVASIYEAPRYIDGRIYPVNSQQFTCDLLINFIISTVNFLKSYMPLYNSIDRAYIKSKILQKDILPTEKSGWEYGVVVNGVEYDTDKRLRTTNRIPVDSYTYYDIVPSYDNLYYSLDLYSNYGGGTIKFVNWQNGQSRIYTDGFTQIRVNISTGNPAGETNGMNMPALWHDYDLVVKKTDLSDVDIKSTLSSTVATIDYARMQKVGRMAFVVLRMTMTANATAGTQIVSGLPVDINNYNGLNNVRLYNHGTLSCVDGYISHASGATSSFIACLSELTSGSSIRATFMYFTAE